MVLALHVASGGTRLGPGGRPPTNPCESGTSCSVDTALKPWLWNLPASVVGPSWAVRRRNVHLDCEQSCH